MVSEHDMDREQLSHLLTGAEKRQSIIKAMTRPAEAKPWHQYRPIFITDKRISEGVAFWRDNRPLLEQVEKEFGIPIPIIVAIIGVETSYGKILGSYRVLDALSTLAFHYPPRAKFFRSELKHFMILGREEGVSLEEAMGSYAGAMGLGQFISSSYRSYAVDFDGDGSRNLWHSRPDAIASVANYFKRHGWKSGDPVATPATRRNGARVLSDVPIKPAYPTQQLIEWGYTPAEAPATPDQVATLIELENIDGAEYWLGFHNFYVISRYNHSALYSMAVYQLSQKIEQQMTPQGGP
jgi:membrane-bound lytic murein transglycosylase B